jgi:hypothetical protein
MNTKKNGTKRGRAGALLFLAAFFILASVTGMAAGVSREKSSFCGECEFQVGMGGTYHSFESTGGDVIPITMTWAGGRWELGVFHFSEQVSTDNDENVERVVARPYWGASVSRRFELYERGPLRALFGFGLSYRTETDCAERHALELLVAVRAAIPVTGFSGDVRTLRASLVQRRRAYAQPRPGLHDPHGALRSLNR